MFTLRICFLAIALGAFAVAGCGRSDDQSDHGHDHGHVHKYTCTMHPEIVQDKPGECPTCKMQLVEKH